jgi:phosphatidylinositol-3-phosphatase
MKRTGRIKALALAALALTVLAGLLSGAAARQKPASAPALTLPPAAAVPAAKSSHLAVIVMENKGYRQIIGNPRAPYINELASRYALATHFFAVTHPSLPNYVAMTAGSTHGVRTDAARTNIDGPSLLSQLSRAGVSWKAYIAGVPSRCYLADKAPGYTRALNPFAYFEGITQDPARCRRLVPLAQLGTDLRRGTLPAFSWITPSLCMDTHFCPVGTGDRFLSRLVPPLLRRLGPHGAVFILWDEGTSNKGCCGSSGGGHVPALVVGPDVRPGDRITKPLDSYAALRTFESGFGLLPLGQARSVPATGLSTAFSPKLVLDPDRRPPRRAPA